ncbi:hypothetical protein [Plantactinospora sonchi]|uniref:Mce-associated membrane protein n=1 Tax=Plantactinospora sonchi TaxID=1544735 RepID=A0ABU7S129_9ACTN
MGSFVSTLTRRLRPGRRTEGGSAVEGRAAPVGVDQVEPTDVAPTAEDPTAPTAEGRAALAGEEPTTPTAEGPATTAREGRGDGGRRFRRLRLAAAERLHLALTVATVLAVGAAGAAWYTQHRAQARDAAVRQALATATPAAKAIFSYDYRNFDASVTNGRAFVTGPFADEYTETTTALKPTAVSEQAVVLAEVSVSGVVQAEPDRVELLVYLNQYRRNINTDGEKVDQNRVVLELRPVGAEWKVARATAI